MPHWHQTVIRNIHYDDEHKIQNTFAHSSTPAMICNNSSILHGKIAYENAMKEDSVHSAQFVVCANLVSYRFVIRRNRMARAKINTDNKKCTEVAKQS